MKKIEEILRDHRFFSELPDEDLLLIAGCGKNEIHPAGKYLAHEGEAADRFYLIRHGRIAIESQTPGRGALVIETLTEGEVVGWSWLFPPYRWTFDVRAIEESRLIALDGRCLRGKADANPALGYRLMKSFARVMSDRLRAARMQMLDIYGQVEK
jgi:CRP/FNR family cyclic AMP-dependent transcriptional regulator